MLQEIYSSFNHPPINKYSMNAKKKGNAGEWSLIHWMKRHGFNSFRNAMSGGSVWKGDVANDLDLTIEIKTVKSINLKKAWAQVSKDASVARNSPLLAIHFDQMPKDQWLMVIHSEDWINMQKDLKK